MAPGSILLFLFLAGNAGALPETSPDDLLREHLWSELTALPAGERPVVGLALSAGALRGLGHVGVLRVLEDNGFPIDVVAGTSMGAVIGSFYAAGVPVSKLWEMRHTMRLDFGSNFNWVRLVSLMLRDRLLSTRPLERLLREELGDLYFHQLQKPFGCVAMDLKTGEKIVFRQGPLAPAVRASANLPGVFAPVEYRHRYLVDGGVVDYVPADVARLLGADWVIASVTEGDFTSFAPTNVLAALSQVIDIRGSLLSRQQRRLADALVEPAVGDIGFYEVERAAEAMDKGVVAAHNKVRPIQQDYILHSLPRLVPRWRGKL